MKICYIDESGNDQAKDPYLVMVGIVIDSQRVSRTREEFAEIFERLQNLFEESLREIKGSKLVSGRDRWRKIEPETRKTIVSGLCEWIRKRKHNLALAAIDRQKFHEYATEALPAECKDKWLAAALHIVLQIQKAHQQFEGNKGLTVLIFDDNKHKADRLSEVIWQPPEWTDEFYGKKKKQDRFDQVLDTTFTVKSHHAGLIQVADLFAYLFRRFAELKSADNVRDEYEAALIYDSLNILAERLLDSRFRWPKKAKVGGAPAEWYRSIAPTALLNLAIKQ